MMKNRLILLIVLLFGFNTYTVITKRSNEKRYVNVLTKEQATNNQLKNELNNRSNYIETLYTASVPSDKRIDILEKLKGTNFFGSKKVVFFYDKNACGSCINETMYELKKLGLIIGDNKIGIVTNAINTNGSIMENEEKGFWYLPIDTFYMEAEKLEEPMVFVVDKLLHIDLLYMPKLYPELKKKYFTEIIPRYFENL